jgi:hypothetical protein
MERWKMFCAGLQKQDSNQSLEAAIELADPYYYPNLPLKTACKFG